MYMYKSVVYLAILLVILLILSIGIRYFVDPLYTPVDLQREGVVLIPDLLSNHDLQVLQQSIDRDDVLDTKKYIMTSPSIRAKMDELLGKDYVFQDYIFLIKRSQFHTCHRDYNGDLYNADQKKPSYTILFYVTDMGKCLDVIPESHLSMKHNVNWTDYTKSIPCKKGDAILFNANMVHNGSLNETDNTRIQMKLTHSSDLEALQFYNNYNKVMDSPSTHSMMYKRAQKHFSCQFPILSNFFKQFDNNKPSTDQHTGLSALLSSFSAPLRTVM